MFLSTEYSFGSLLQRHFFFRSPVSFSWSERCRLGKPWFSAILRNEESRDRHLAEPFERVAPLAFLLDKTSGPRQDQAVKQDHSAEVLSLRFGLLANLAKAQTTSNPPDITLNKQQGQKHERHAVMLPQSICKPFIFLQAEKNKHVYRSVKTCKQTGM